MQSSPALLLPRTVAVVGRLPRSSYRAFTAEEPVVFAIPKSSTQLAAFSAEQVLGDRIRSLAPRFPTEIGTSRPLRM